MEFNKAKNFLHAKETVIRAPQNERKLFQLSFRQLTNVKIFQLTQAVDHRNKTANQQMK